MYKQYTRGEIIPVRSGERIPRETLIPRGPGEYYANITYMDAQLGRVLNELDATGTDRRYDYSCSPATMAR